MATDLEKLVVTLEASIRQYERAMAKAQQTTVTAMRGIEKTTAGTMKKQEAIMSAAGKRMGGALQSAFAGVTRGLGAGLVAGLGIEQISEAVGKAVKDIANLADQAQQLGMTAQDLQTWNRMAVESGESTETMGRALAKVAEQSRDADSELSKLFAQFRQVPTGDVTEDMKTLMDILQQMPDPAQRLATLMNVLGERIGPKLAEALTQGPEKFIEVFARMNAAGEHFNDQELQRMQELEAEWNLMTDKMDTAWKQMILSAMREGQSLLNLMNSSRDAFQSWWGLTPGGSARFQGLQRSYGPSYDPLSSIHAPRSMGSVTTPDVMLRQRGATATGAAMLQNQFAANLARALRDAERATGAQARITSTGRTYAEQAELYRRYRAGIGGLAAPPGRSRHEIGMAADIGAGPVLDWLHAHAREYNLEFLKGRAFVNDPGHIQMRGGGAEFDTEARTAQRTAAAEKRTAVKEKEAEATKKLSAAELERNRIYDEAESAITMFSEKRAQQVEDWQAQAQQMEEFGGMLAGAVSGFVQDLMNGVDAGEAFTNMLKNLAAQLMDMAIKQLFSGLFGGGGMGGGLLGGILGGGAPAMAGAGAGMIRMGGGALKSGSSGSAITVGGATINVAGNADTRTVAMMSKMIEVNNQRQSAMLDREWGRRGARYKTLRSP